MRSLDCSKLISIQTQLVCGDAELARIDRTLTEIYYQKIKLSSDKSRLRADQRAWLRNSRNVCGDKACLLRSYHRRIDELKRMRS
nr:lysozyme inhibitor LprI family protein [Cupriavidus sp. P-10]